MQNPVTNACKFWSSCCTLCFSHRKLAHTTFSPRIKGLASGTEMTGRTLHQFFHFDMPPCLVILLLELNNIAFITNECNSWCFCCFGGNNKSVKEVCLRNMCYVGYDLVMLALCTDLGPRFVKLK